MICPKCNSENVTISREQISVETRAKRSAWSSRKVESEKLFEYQTVALCHSCGNNWDVDKVENAVHGCQKDVSNGTEKTMAIFLCALGYIGIGGLHQFYVGKKGMGLLYLITYGFFLIGTTVDLIKLVNGTFQNGVAMAKEVELCLEVRYEENILYNIIANSNLSGNNRMCEAS